MGIGDLAQLLVVGMEYAGRKTATGRRTTQMMPGGAHGGRVWTVAVVVFERWQYRDEPQPPRGMATPSVGEGGTAESLVTA